MIVIYIPIWLDLLWLSVGRSDRGHTDLHSNMVRFIIYRFYRTVYACYWFTFQYGYIYYEERQSVSGCLSNIYIPIWLYLLWGRDYRLQNGEIIYIPIWLYLLSIGNAIGSPNCWKFTFQYGYIYYKHKRKTHTSQLAIYIPIWLYLLLNSSIFSISRPDNLHSNMVIFIINVLSLVSRIPGVFTFQYGYIYYLFLKLHLKTWLLHLHSNMVIFIILFHFNRYYYTFRFTFQYGYIYYFRLLFVLFFLWLIYIPIWLYLLSTD